LAIGRRLSTSSASESPLGRTDRTLNNSLLPDVTRGLKTERLIDTSKFEFLSYPTERRDIFSVSLQYIVQAFIVNQMGNKIYQPEAYYL
jgi:hypothetical protein